jgi:hypothetical protein
MYIYKSEYETCSLNNLGLHHFKYKSIFLLTFRLVYSLSLQTL